MSSDGMTFEEILKMPFMADVAEELADHRFASRSHGSRATGQLGCSGPLCRLSETLRGRRRNQAKAAREGKEYIEGKNRRYDREELLLDIMAWHKADLFVRKQNGVYARQEQAS